MFKATVESIRLCLLPRKISPCPSNNHIIHGDFTQNGVLLWIGGLQVLSSLSLIVEVVAFVASVLVGVPWLCFGAWFLHFCFLIHHSYAAFFEHQSLNKAICIFCKIIYVQINLHGSNFISIFTNRKICFSTLNTSSHSIFDSCEPFVETTLHLEENNI